MRLSVEPGGCSGFQYRFELEERSTLEEADSVFEKDGAHVVVDEASLELVAGSTVDFEDEVCVCVSADAQEAPLARARTRARRLFLPVRPQLFRITALVLAQMMKSSFVVAENPQSSAGCGCGSSFQVEL